MKTIAVVALLCALVPACGSDAPSCTDGIQSFYAAGCYLYVDSTAASPIEAIGYCEAGKEGGGSCPSRIDTLLRCMGDVESVSQCEVCNPELASAASCG